MWPWHPELLATPVPRYTSYPTAAEFHDGLGAADMTEALAEIAPGEAISLYLHIPYCEHICWYCGCNTGAANRTHRLTAYLEALEAEVDQVAARAGSRRIGRVAFGGGSPNAIPAGDFERLVSRLGERFDLSDAMLSVELDPRSLNDEWLAAMARVGVARASLGVQTLSEEIQQAIGRLQPRAVIEAATEGLRAAGVESLNFDLMYGLPGQGVGELEETIAGALAMGPDRIALFGYAHVPHLIPRQRRIDGSNLPDAEARFRQAERGHTLLTAAGYEAIGFDHFARPGDAIAIAARTGTLRRNFQGFTEDKAGVLIGLGASAISSFPDRLIQNEKNAGRYRMLVSAERPAATRGIRRDAAEQARGRIIEAILCTGAADIGPLAASVAPRLAPFVERGLVRIEENRLALAPGAVPYARTLASLFDRHRAADAARFSHAI